MHSPEHWLDLARKAAENGLTPEEEKEVQHAEADTLDPNCTCRDSEQGMCSRHTVDEHHFQDEYKGKKLDRLSGKDKAQGA